MKDKIRKLEPPKSDLAADLARATARAVVGAIPITGGALAEAASFILPDPTAVERQRWEGDVSNAVNDLHGRVQEISAKNSDKKVSLTGAAPSVAKYITEHCSDGLGHHYISFEELTNNFPNYPSDEILCALGELESYGLIKSIDFIGRSPEYKITYEGYRALDPVIMGWDNVEDAKSIAKLVVKMKDGCQSSLLEASLGWSRRRFNPALRIVLEYVGEGRVSKNLQPDYVTSFFSPSNAEMAVLRRFSVDA